MDPTTYLAQFFLVWEVFQTKAVEKNETYFMFNHLFPKIVRFWDNVEKYGTASHRCKYGARAFYIGYLELQTHRI